MKNKRKLYSILLKIRENATTIAFVMLMSTILISIFLILINMNQPLPTENYSTSRLFSLTQASILATMLLMNVYFFVIGNIYDNKQAKIATRNMNRTIETLKKKFIEMNNDSQRNQQLLNLILLVEQIEEPMYDKKNSDNKLD